ncbi:MAG: family 16 glycosylhydrolase [Cyclobacteriaceae bacterium]
MNEEGWVLNESLSDEFEGSELDPGKWFVEGQNGDYYIWKGRAPSQFVPHNAFLEDGKLKLRTQWEPDYPFAQESYADGSNNDSYGIHEGQPLPVTTAGVITKKRFLNGYMEIKSKVGNAAITGAFWAIGYEQELDVFEQMGNPKLSKDGSIRENTIRTAVHDWSPPAVRPTKAFGNDEQVAYRTADEFHIYGAEWGRDYLKIFRDGELTYHVNQDELGTDWVLNNPMEIWLDSEIFKWLGVPHKEELPVDFEIEYLRVWQKPNDNLLAPQFYGFEGPILFEEEARPLMLLPESSVPDGYQKFWLIDSISAKYFVINEGQYSSGVNSLEFTGFGKNEKLEAESVVALSPKGAINIPSGDYELSFNIWLNQGRAVSKLYLSFENPKLEIPIDLTGLERQEWITIKRDISRSEASSSEDQFKIEIRAEDVPEIKASKLFIDDIAIKPNTN